MPSYSSHPLSLLNPPPISCHPSLALVRVHHPSAFESPFEAAFDYNQSPRALRPYSANTSAFQGVD